MSLFADARYIRDFDVQSARLSPLGAFTGAVEDDLDSFQLNLGVRFSF